MDAPVTEWRQQWQAILRAFRKQAPLGRGHIVVIGCSTSEVLGERIGTAGSMDVAAMLFAELEAWRRETGIELAFQCCEHLNRALVVERETARAHGLEVVSVVPVPQAGGAMAAYAYRNLANPVVVEAIRADAGIDIGHTLIGMHLKPVAVPVRVPVKQVGAAHVTLAKTRPKLIGGARAVYSLENPNDSCTF
ncbi:TIGR01440 family protein [Geobacillus sp. 46C-IIa]|uniref:TIGR01440 family protein n=1 Tax=Geobacillus sp. 46C-IIa TaxID=1963025 RepID=UPI0009BE4936|nr:TIGR01440 family protein [Geobacillus sp. 46C-IIa]OQP06660.1 TIGR01440 family protein [Geobacillus sp. 46C-IIa]QNU28007.1 TIGR01440 family protein [Geobacillus sp. 46C-IIa]